MGLVFHDIRRHSLGYVYVGSGIMKFFKWLKKWYWDIWFDNGPEPDEDYMHLSHDERIEKLREMIRK